MLMSSIVFEEKRGNVTNSIGNLKELFLGSIIIGNKDYYPCMGIDD
tara:strand:+ start:1092 stop:1229 length:138 start_codon:yes stop_codon:yes gene_type:complete